MKTIKLFSLFFVLMSMVAFPAPTIISTTRAAELPATAAAAYPATPTHRNLFPEVAETSRPGSEPITNTLPIIPELIGQLGGPPTAITLHDDLAYMGIGQRLLIVDIFDPSLPSTVGQTSVLPGVITAVVAVGNFAYVTDGEGGLHIINISDPASPSESGFYDTPGDARDVMVMGSYAYVADWYGLRIIDISNPANPTETGFCDTVIPARGVTVAGSYAYIARHGGLTIIDVSNPASPTEVGNVDTQGIGYAVAVVGSYAYLASEDGGLRIIDISNPASPAEVGFYDTPGFALDVSVVGIYAYVADGGSGLRVIDVSNPAAPTEVGFYNTPGDTLAVAVEGNYAYVNFDANVAYMENIENSGMRIVEISNPASPTEVGFYVSPGVVIEVTIAGTYAYLAAQNGGLHIIDISNPATPIEAGFYDTPGTSWGVAVAENYAYVADWDRGLRIIDISNPASPTETGSYDTPGNAIDVMVAGSYAYVADGSSGLRIIDITNPVTPTEVGYYDTPGSAIDVTISGNHAYVADLSGLRIIDISNPVSPFEVGFYNATGYSYGVTVAGDYAYIAYSYGTDTGGLRIVDISNSTTPTEVGYYDTTGSTRNVTVTGNYAFLASRNYGLHIIDVINPTTPIEVGYFDTPGSAFGVSATSNLMYIADRTAGLIILRYEAASINTTTSIASDDPDPSQMGQPFTVTIGVTSTIGIPTGAVTVTVSDSADTCSGVLVGGLGACQLALSTPGIYTLTATYAGEGDFQPSSDSELHTVDSITTISTTTSIASDDPDPSQLGQPFTVTFGVTSTLGIPTGVVSVTVSDSPETCSGELAGGLGACQMALSAPGAYTLTATYAGEGDFQPSSDGELHTVNAVTTITTTTSILSDDPDPSLVGQPFTVTFGVTSDLGIPTGAVTVTVSESSEVCGAELVDGLGVCQMTLSSPGTFTLNAAYAGEGDFLPSSASEQHTVDLRRVYLPMVIKPPEVVPGLTGKVTINGVPIGGISLDLRFYDGSNFSTVASTTTGTDGNYLFSGVPALQTGQFYYVRYPNNEEDNTRLSLLVNRGKYDLQCHFAGNIRYLRHR